MAGAPDAAPPACRAQTNATNQLLMRELLRGMSLTFLQLFWGYKIVKILAKQFSGNAVDRSKEA